MPSDRPSNVGSRDEIVATRKARYVAFASSVRAVRLSFQASEGPDLEQSEPQNLAPPSASIETGQMSPARRRRHSAVVSEQPEAAGLQLDFSGRQRLVSSRQQGASPPQCWLQVEVSSLCFLLNVLVKGRHPSGGGYFGQTTML
ncbi:hypothetical protein B0T16DRAFT_396077 [Cercophora newfieldiana]|uniref:Uncharacterized protein n=1 Tax=Cercophora newfieldiana TaxID=92897 RepID=A0AA39YLZ1_9PEZI|nr:hypothetical protein B0T16DRAFT_396077 [Cercophora newfieldiana]